MSHILHLIVSPRAERSHSRALSQFFVQQWTKKFPADSVSTRDLRETLIPHVTEEFIAAEFTPPELQTPAQQQILAQSNALAAELKNADVLVIGTPLYNQGAPSALVAWIDAVVRVGLTFNITRDGEKVGLEPSLSPGKRAFVMVTSGGAGYEPGGDYVDYNTLEPKLRAGLGFIGLNEWNFVYAGGDTLGGMPEQLEAARLEIVRLIESAS